MTVQKRTVAVKQLPEVKGPKQEQMFLREMQNCMNADRPWIVLDCSSLRQMDKSAVYLVLCCLEEAMKRNGDVKLACLPPNAETLLNATGAGRIFDIYDTTAGAVSSFYRVPAFATSPMPFPAAAVQMPEGATQLPESAA